MEGRERTWDIVSTQAVAASLANKRNHVRTALPGFIDYFKNMERYEISPVELRKQILSYPPCTTHVLI